MLDALFLALFLCALDAFRVEVRFAAAAPQDDEAVIVPGGLGDGGESLLRYTHEVMFRGRCSDRIDCDAQAPIRAVLETDGE